MPVALDRGQGQPGLQIITILWVKPEHILCELADGLIFPPIRHLFNLLREALYSPLYTLSGHYGGIVIPPRWTCLLRVEHGTPEREFYPHICQTV